MSEGEDEQSPRSTIVPKEQLEQFPEGQRDLVEETFAQYEMIRSPLLPPEILKQYGDVIPGLDEKIVEWVEAETGHRQALEKQEFEEARDLRKRAQFAGPLIAGTGIVMASAIAIFSPSWSSTAVAVVMLIASIGGPFAARILATRWSGDNRSETED